MGPDEWAGREGMRGPGADNTRGGEHDQRHANDQDDSCNGT